MKKLAIITSHPIQYNAPLFSLISRRGHIQIKVFYTWGESVLDNKFDPGFGKVIQWDIPLLDGYPYIFVRNTASDQGTHHFKGMVNPTLINEIENFEADAVLVFGWSFQSHLKVLRYFAGRIPVFFRGDSHLLDYTPPIKRMLRKWFLRYIYKHVSVAFYVGKHNKDYFLNAGIKESKLIFAPHAIDNSRFSCTDKACISRAKEYRQQLNIPEDAFVFLFAGKLEKKKSPLTLIEAFNQISKKESVYLIMAGNGPLEDSVIEAATISANIKTLPFQNQQSMPALYSACNVFVLPSAGPGETWGLAVNEAMAAGKTVIVSDKCGCYSDLVKEGVNGFTFQSENLNSLTTALISSMTLKPEVVKCCNSKILSLYSYETVAQALEVSLNYK
ncbi:MAG: glycosyltransferase family 4 protein [Ferruginibacter sp.]|nr:glycosyltransferase family 4 protein [Ferruginibacter sp.]